MKARYLFLVTAALAALAPLVSGDLDPRPAASAFPGWMTRWEGIPLKRLPLSWREQRFAEGFPGQIAHFSDGRRLFVIRYTERPTRKLHPAAACFRGAGYQTRPLPQHRDASGSRWNTFRAAKGDEILEVRERIFNNGGQSWPDVSAWFWSAAYGSRGPWWAVTVIERAGG